MQNSQSYEFLKIGDFWPKASQLPMTITLRILLGLFQDWKPEILWPWGVRTSWQKFLPLLDHRNFWTFRIFSNFFSKKSIFRDFDDRFFQWRGCGWSEISFWRDPYWLEVKHRGRPKSWSGPPRWVANIFWLVMIVILVFCLYLKNMQFKRFTEFPR